MSNSHGNPKGAPLKWSLALLGLWSALATGSVSYGDHPAALALVEQLVEEETTEPGFDRDYLLEIMASAQRQDRILEAIARPAEKVKPWHEYRQIFLTEQREREGLQFYAAHRATLERAETEMGVPAAVIAAIMGVETYYGRITGNYRVIDALATLAFDYPRRSGFFTRELKSYLLLTREQGLDPLSLNGSYAGAMGYGQFMPSSYRSYAVDFDDDGVIDIWRNPVDAIGSVANYLRRHGWRSGEGVAVAAQHGSDVAGAASPKVPDPGIPDPGVPDPGVPEHWFNAGLVPERTVEEFTRAGLQPLRPLDPGAKVTAMRFEGADGDEHWLGLHNFYVITRYNHSAMYAMSVHQLSQRLAEGVMQGVTRGIVQGAGQ
ncbi:lytic murein transglycosylase B [Kineobactrum sediminis]|uniref:Lytic murein transglycosylase B n=1 Tax=Kineobactrum sediminis TaxID=1905677 RepID=A0A2N5Y6R5_9GAMM|nr:lytic murein transglycosylase B [Kineobactrum sediminis]PLW84077.1 lytic murein transglycosylase B [Kineobactrum sediminis]